MALKDIIEEIKKLSTADQYRLKEFFANSLASYSTSEPVFKEYPKESIKMALLVLTAILITQFVSVNIR